MEKYKPIIPDWEKFKQQADKHPLQGIRKNPLKAREDFEEKLRDKFDIERSGWNKNIYKVNCEKPGKTLLHWRGEYYVQEESAALPVSVLNPQPGEKILDMCAAPGGKTTQIAAIMENKGLVVSNDKSQQRMKSLHANIYRTGAKNVEATNYDGRNIPEEQKYDKILVDAPCSGEGDRYYRNFKPADPTESKSLRKIQKQLLKKAEKLLKPQGTLVYSTCTITPKENEKTVNKTLKQTKLKLENIKTQAKHVKGIQKFNEQKYREEMNKTVRVYPHHMNSGVIYVAKFSK
jgi:NOL1/NOP2/sun family putative RNA methylase